MQNLIIIGNGFDLAHGLKTSYTHFIEHLVNKHCEDRQYCRDLFNLPADVKKFEDLKQSRHKYPNGTATVETWLSANDPKKINNGVFKSVLIYELIQEFHRHNWCDIEQFYFKLLNFENDLLNRYNPKYYTGVKPLNDDFQVLKNHLEEYLVDQEKEATTPIAGYKEFFSAINYTDTLILNFNYTHTIEKLYADETSNSKIIHIHGELENPDNPIVFGYAASHEESRGLLSKNNKEYLRNIKKHLYKRTDNEHQLSKYLDNHQDIFLSVLGHSCGLSDKLILEQILNHKNISKEDRSIRIFYHKEYENYFETQVNIDRIMGDDERFRTLLVDFQSSDRMPQANDTSRMKKFIESVREYKLYDPNELPADGVLFFGK